MVKGRIGCDGLTMEELRNALEEQVKENQLLRPLIVKNARLKQEVKICRKFLSEDDAKRDAHEVSLARALPVQL